MPSGLMPMYVRYGIGTRERRASLRAAQSRKCHNRNCSQPDFVCASSIPPLLIAEPNRTLVPQRRFRLHHNADEPNRCACRAVRLASFLAHEHRDHAEKDRRPRATDRGPVPVETVRDAEDKAARRYATSVRLPGLPSGQGAAGHGEEALQGRDSAAGDRVARSGSVSRK